MCLALSLMLRRSAEHTHCRAIVGSGKPKHGSSNCHNYRRLYAMSSLYKSGLSQLVSTGSNTLKPSTVYYRAVRRPDQTNRRYANKPFTPTRLEAETFRYSETAPRLTSQLIGVNRDSCLTRPGSLSRLRLRNSSYYPRVCPVLRVTQTGAMNTRCVRRYPRARNVEYLTKSTVVIT